MAPPGSKRVCLRPLLGGLTVAQVFRALKRLRLHGLIKKAGRAYKYYLTALGTRSAPTRLKLPQLVPRRGIRSLASATSMP